jgi:hypothetical protein
MFLTLKKVKAFFLNGSTACDVLFEEPMLNRRCFSGLIIFYLSLKVFIFFFAELFIYFHLSTVCLFISETRASP